MVKNNLKSFLIHIIISIISIIVFIAFNSSQVKWASEEAANSHHYFMMFIAFILIAVAVSIYYLLGRKFLVNQGNIYKNLISTSLTAILGVFLWVIAFNINIASASSYLLNSEFWQFYSMYNGYALFFLNESRNNNPYVFLLFSFIPTAAMVIGLLRKRG